MILKSKKGTSLVTVIVSFAILLMVILMVHMAISLAGKLSNKADKIWKATDASSNNYAREKYESENAASGVTIKVGDEIIDKNVSIGQVEKGTEGINLYFFKSGDEP